MLLKASVPEAAHDSSTRDPPPRCFPGTRRQYVEDIVHWTLSAADHRRLPLFWMKGAAGVGKSAVAQTCVETLSSLGMLGAGYFFSVNGRNKHEPFFNTIAYQLSTVFPHYRDLIDLKIRRDTTLVNKSMASQFRALIIEPLQELENQGRSIGARVPIFIDGLDECESPEAQCQIIELIASSARDGSTPFCWAFFSRPERHIEATFSQANVAPLCHKITLPISRDVDGEIELYLRAGFDNILQRCNLSLAPSLWPSRQDMKILVDAAAGLFVYAATVLRFIGQSASLGPEEPLRAVLDAISYHRSLAGNGVPMSPFTELDGFYMLIMQRIPEKAVPITQLLCAVLCFCGPLSYRNGWGAMVLGNLLKLSEFEFKTICYHLSSVVHFQDQGGPLTFHGADTTLPFYHLSPPAITNLCAIVRTRLGGSISFYHKSFYDFLVDPKRSGKFCVKSPMMDNVLFEHCLSVRLKLEESYSIKDSSKHYYYLLNVPRHSFLPF